jgi:hypothetical protein
MVQYISKIFFVYLKVYFYRRLLTGENNNWYWKSETKFSSKTSVFCDIKTYSLLEVNRSFGRIYRLHLHGYCLLFASRMFLVWLILRHWSSRRHVPLKRRLTFNGTHGVISQKIEIFLTTAVRTLNPTELRHWTQQYVYMYVRDGP